MAIPTNPLDPLSFGDLNDEIGNATTDQLDLIQAGLDFGYSPGGPDFGGDWTDGVAGLSMSEFKGGSVVTGLALNADITNVGAGYALTENATPGPTGAPGGTYHSYLLTQPGTTYPSGNPAGLLTSGPHSVPIEITSDGTYVIQNPSGPIGGTLNPTAGGTEGIITANPHVANISSLPAYGYEDYSQLPTPLQAISSPGGINRGLAIVYDQYLTPTSGPVFDLERLDFTSLYNDKTLTQNPTPVPYNAGTYQVSTIDWKFNTYFSLDTQGPANPAPDTNPIIVSGFSVGSVGVQPSISNFLRTEVDVTVNYNNSPTPRETFIYAYVPFSGPEGGAAPSTWGAEMNRNGNEFNPFYDGYYYPIPVIQDGSPATANTLTLTPSSIPFDTNGGTSVPISLNITPNTNSFSYTSSPFITVNGLPTPNSGDKTFTVSVGTSGTPRNGEVLFTHPGGTTPLQVSQTGVDVGVNGYDAALGPVGNTFNRPVSYGASSLATPVFTNSPSNAPWTAIVLPSPTPFISFPAPTSRSGPAPTFQANFPVNNTQSQKNQTIEFDFNVGGTPYITRFNVTQAAAPLPLVNIPAGSNRNLPYNGGSTFYEVFANEPFTVNFTSPTPKLTINPTSTNFPAPSPGGALVPYSFTITAAANPIYEVYQSTFEVTSPIFPNPNQSPVGPISYTQTLAGNPFDVTISYNPSSPPISGAFGGAWSYNPSNELSLPSSGGSVTAGVKATRLSDSSLVSVPITFNYVTPNPAVVTGPVPYQPPQSGIRTSPGTITLNIPSNPSTSYQRSFYVTLTSPFPVGSSQIDGLQAKFVPEFSIPTSTITIPEGGGTVPRGLTANVAWSTSANPAPWLTVSPTSGASPATISFTGDPVGSSPRSTNVVFTSPLGGPKTVPVVQYAPEPDAFNLPTTPATIPYLGGPTPSPRALTTTPASLPWSITNTYPWISVSVGPTGNGPATVNFSAPENTGAYRSGGVTFNNPVSPVFIPVAQPAPPVPDTLGISPTNVVLPYSIGFGETITATGTGTSAFNKINNNPAWIEVLPSGPAVAPAPFTINALSGNPLPTPRVGSVDISHPANNYTITVTQEGIPEPAAPEPAPAPCHQIQVTRSSSSAASACSATRLVNHYFNASSLNAADRYYGLSSDCSTLQTGTYWVSDFDETNSWAKFVDGIRTDFGFCGF